MRRPNRPVETLLAFLLACCAFAPFVHYGLNLEDEGGLLAEFWRVYSGEVPGRDFQIGYTPLAHHFHAALFGLFGVSTTPVRVALVLCHATLIALLYALGRRRLPVAFAALAPLLYAAIMPFFPGRFASFNIPYPAWYTALFLVAHCAALVRFAEMQDVRWLAVAGLAAGLCFGFKPNAGLFAAASAGLVLLSATRTGAEGSSAGGVRADTVDVILWWTIALALVPALLLVFGTHARMRVLAIFVAPVAALVALLVVGRAGARSTNARGVSLHSALLVYAASALAIVLPWALAYLTMLGPRLFVRRVLFYDAGFEGPFYYEFHHATLADAVLVAATLGVALLATLVRSRRLSVRALAVMAAIVGLVAAVALTRARMPEGFAAALRSRLEDSSFTATLLVEWAAIFVVAVTWLWRRDDGADRELFVVVAAASTSLMLLYPRSDFMHLVTAAPLVLLLGVLLAARLATWLAPVPIAAASVRVAVLGAGMAIAALAAVARVGAVVTWAGGPTMRPLATLDLTRAPIALERGRAPRLAALRATVAYVQAHTQPGEPIFPFPAVDLVCFLADRRNAAVQGYYFPGSPGHDVEAEVVAQLRAAAPRLIVTMHDHQLFVTGAAAYYYALRDEIDRHYRIAAQFGPFVVLAREDLATATPARAPDTLATPAPLPDTLATLASSFATSLGGATRERLRALRALARERVDAAWPPLMAALTDRDTAVRSAALDALADASDPDVALDVANALAADLVAPDRRLAALRLVLGCGDGRALLPLLTARRRLAGTPDHEMIDVILATIAEKAIASTYWLGVDPAVRRQPALDLDAPTRAAILVDDDVNVMWRLFMVRALAHPPAVPGARAVIEAALADPDAGIVVAAANALMRLDAQPDVERVLDALLSRVALQPMLAPSLVLELHRRAPAVTAERLASALRAADPSSRRELAWIVASCRDPALRTTLVAMRGDADRVVRMAAVAGLAALGGPDDRHVLAAASNDEDPDVQRLARRLLAVDAGAAPGDAS